MSSPAVILLAHQDDEIPVLPLIMQYLNPIDTHIVFLTSGTSDGSISLRRNKESWRNLTQLGISDKNLHFIGSSLAVADKTLSKNLEHTFRALSELILKYLIKNIYTMAWEGGHPDHDAVYLLGVTIAHTHGLINRCQQFSWYNGALDRTLNQVKLFNPLAKNGRVYDYAIKWHYRIKWLFMALRYPSQIKVLLWLYPLLLSHILRKGNILLQPCSISRIKERPTKMILRYEQNSFYTYSQFQKDISPFIKNHLPEILND